MTGPSTAAPPEMPPQTNVQPQASTVSISAPNRKMSPPRIMLYAVEGWGKSTAGAQAPKPIIVMTSGETGYLTLLGHGLVPEVPVVEPYVNSWPQLMATVEHLIEAEHDRRTVVFDGGDGMERLLHEHVCARDYQGNWSKKGFYSYQDGLKMALNDWIIFLRRLEVLQEKRRMMILFLMHSDTRNTPNPEGEDFKRFTANLDQRTWGATHKWCDAVLFGDFHTVVRKQDGKARAMGGTDRVLYCDHRATHDAKNRYAMPSMIQIPDDRTRVWSTIWNAITKDNSNGNG